MVTAECSKKARTPLATTDEAEIPRAAAPIHNGAPCCSHCGYGNNFAQDEPEYWVQDIGPLNLFSDLLLCTVMELNSHIGNSIESADFVHVSEVDGELMLSFSSMLQLFSMRDVFMDMVEMRGLECAREINFDAMEVIAYPSVSGTGFIISWGPAAAVSEE